MEQAKNKVKIEGILSEIDLKTGSFKKNDKEIPSISGSIKVKVKTADRNLEIPVHIFASKYTNNGNPNPAYESAEKVMNMVSIAASDEETADCVRITNATISMNEYFSQNGELLSYPRISTSFVNKIARSSMEPEANFELNFVVANKNYELNKEGEETGRYKIVGILPQYGGKVDVINLYGVSKNVINAIEDYWNVNDTVSAIGRLNFTSETKTVEKAVDFGDPIKETKTFSVSDLIITGGSSTPMADEFAYQPEDIKKALAERKVRLENLKNKKKEVKDVKKEMPKKVENDFSDLGF